MLSPSTWYDWTTKAATISAIAGAAKNKKTVDTIERHLPEPVSRPRGGAGGITGSLERAGGGLRLFSVCTIYHYKLRDPKDCLMRRYLTC
jgi:hypothetical protein